MKNAFTMIELIFVIVVLGILAGVAIPRMTATRDDATLAAMKANIATIQSAVQNQHAADLVAGRMTYRNINFSSTATANNNTWIISDLVGSKIKMEGSKPRNGLYGGNNNEFSVAVGGKTATFTFTPANGSWTCAGKICDKLQN